MDWCEQETEGWPSGLRRQFKALVILWRGFESHLLHYVGFFFSNRHRAPVQHASRQHCFNILYYCSCKCIID